MRRSKARLLLVGVLSLSLFAVSTIAQATIGGDVLEVVENYKGEWKATAPFSFAGKGILRFDHEVVPYCECGRAGHQYFVIQYRQKGSSGDWINGLPYAKVRKEPVYSPYPMVDGKPLRWFSEYETLTGAETQEYRILIVPAGYRSGDAWFQPNQRLTVVATFRSGEGTTGIKEITWGTQADSWRGQNGTRFTLRCPAGGSLTGRLWGTDIFTDDSSVCLAAAHAGFIDTSGGVVTIEIRRGESSYKGSSRNGVTSSAYGSWQGSFVFVGGDRDPQPSFTPINWSSQATSWRGQNGARFRLSCPSGGATSGRLWGTDVYTDDSSICLAAIHSGIIGTSGGNVIIEIRPGAASYSASTRNGVTSTAYGSWTGSFVFVRE